MEIATIPVSSVKLLICGQEVFARKDVEMIQNIARHCRVDDTKFVDKRSTDDFSDDLENWFLIVTGWRALPDEVAFVSRFRQGAAFAPILVIAANDDKDARDQAFIAGADNYVSPDASESEIILKASRLRDLAEMAKIAEAPLTFGGLSIWLHANMVMRDHEPISLSRRELAILMCLARNSPEVVSREQMEREALGIRHDPGTNVVAVHIHRIRLKIGNGKNNKLIQSIPGQGYRLSYI